MSSSEEEQIYSIALTMVPGIGHIGAKRLVEGMKSATDVFRFRKELAQRLSCLLYTSPSPRDKRQSRMPSSA